MPDVQQFDPTNPLAQVQAMMKGELEPAKERYAGALSGLQASHTAETPEADYVGRWGAIASGLSQIPITGSSQDFATSLAGAGGAYGAELKKQFLAQQSNKQRGADLEFQDASKRLTSIEGKYLSALSGTNRAFQNPWQLVKIGEGQWARVNKMTNETVPVSTNDAAAYQTAKAEGLKVAMSLGNPDPLNYAEEYANSVITNKPAPIAGGPTVFKPVPGSDTKVTPTKPFDTATPKDFPQPDYQAGLKERLAVLDSERQKYADNPLVMDGLNKEYADTQRRLTTGRPAIADLRPDVERRKEYAGGQGKELIKERTALAQSEAASSTMENQLMTLKKLYESNADITQGEGAGAVKAAKSYLKTFGVDVGPSAGLEDIIQATASNMALHMRTAGGDNLLPGAMSDYESKLLQGMAPGLSMTVEGRKAMIEFMLDITKSNKRIAHEATQYETKNKQLDSGWYARRERVMKEEQARLAARRNEIMAQYGAK